jgi:hypothetical protein
VITEGALSCALPQLGETTEEEVGEGEEEEEEEGGERGEEEEEEEKEEEEAMEEEAEEDLQRPTETGNWFMRWQWEGRGGLRRDTPLLRHSLPGDTLQGTI